MDNVAAWLPLAALFAVGVALGVAARRLGPRGQRAVYLSPLPIATVTAILIWRSPPCADLLDGPCQQNWVSDAAAMGAWVASPLSVVAVVTLAALILRERFAGRFARRS